MVRGCEKFFPALAYLFCLALPGPALALLSKICIPFSRSLYSTFIPVLLLCSSNSSPRSLATRVLDSVDLIEINVQLIAFVSCGQRKR